MQQLATRPWITAGIALAGASLIAATPVTAPPPDVQVSRLIQLIADEADITLDLIRHGQSFDNVNGIIGTVAPGAGLTPTGAEQAAYLADPSNPLHLADPSSYGGIFASGLIRTQETAADWLTAAGAPDTSVVDLSGLNEINAGIFEGAPQNLLTGLGYLAAPLAWTLGLYFVPELGSSDYNGMAFEDRYGDAIQTMYDATSPNGESVGFSHAAAIMIWTMMNVNNPNPLLMLEDPLSNTGQIVIDGNPEDGWTLVSWDGHAVAPANLLQDLFVATRDLITTPQMAAFNVWQALLTLDPSTILNSLKDGVVDVARTTLNYPVVLIQDIIGALTGNISLGLDFGDLPSELAAALPAAATDFSALVPGELSALIGDLFTAL
ncbi:histidine phosphatase family protein [Mycobacterium sp. pUA109]|uniref:histidine phosphatase family protein n=1 Tax=Mycobacterium sp. pUA109 TaxID=3238982 RepID=UPI00351B5D38